MKKISTKQMVSAAMILAMGVLLPMIFHVFGLAGAIFLPMHIPVLIGGFFLSPPLALLLGLLTPLLSSLITGMPVLFPIAIVMIFELSVYGLVFSVMTRKYKVNVIISLLFAMVFGRISAALSVHMMVLLFGIKMNPFIYIKGAIITGIPGIVIQIILVPMMIKAIENRKISWDNAHQRWWGFTMICRPKIIHLELLSLNCV